jgi:hypothetical protein
MNTLQAYWFLYTHQPGWNALHLLVMREILASDPERREEMREDVRTLGPFGAWMLEVMELPDADTRKMLRWMWVCKPRESLKAWRLARRKPWEEKS